MTTFRFQLAATLAVVALLGTPATAAPRQTDPWLAFSALSGRASAEPLSKRPMCRTQAEERAAIADHRAGRLPRCILADDRAAALLAPARGIGTGSMLLGLSGFLGTIVLPMVGWARDKDLRPVSP